MRRVTHVLVTPQISIIAAVLEKTFYSAMYLFLGILVVVIVKYAGGDVSVHVDSHSEGGAGKARRDGISRPARLRVIRVPSQLLVHNLAQRA